MHLPGCVLLPLAPSVRVVVRVCGGERETKRITDVVNIYDPQLSLLYSDSGLDMRSV